MKEYEFLGTEVTFTHRGERHFGQASGSCGGQGGASAFSQITRADGRVETIQSKTVTTLRTGDRVVVETPGGGGYGDPGKRDRKLVEEDVANGKVSIDAARTLYGLQCD